MFNASLAYSLLIQYQKRLNPVVRGLVPAKQLCGLTPLLSLVLTLHCFTLHSKGVPTTDNRFWASKFTMAMD
jgi:hypothetical protein